MTLTETLKIMQKDKTSKVTRNIIFNCHRPFRKGKDVYDQEQSGQLPVDGKLVSHIHDFIMNDRWKTEAEILKMVDLSIGCVHNIMKQLKLYKVSEGLIPRLLSDVDKDRGKAAS